MSRSATTRPGPLALTATALLTVAGLVAGATAATASPTGPAATQTSSEPRNVILLVADGMGYNHVDAASLWEHGTARYQSREHNPFLAVDGPPSVASQVYQHFPVQVGMDTGYVFSPPYADVDAWADPVNATRANPGTRVLVTDSAAAATAFATGVRTRGGYLGVDRDGEPLRGVVDDAADAGRAVGLVTTNRFWGDTVAGFATEATDDDPAVLVPQLLANPDLDVVMGTGHPEWTNSGRRQAPFFGRIDEGTWTSLRDGSAGWRLAETRGDFRSLAARGSEERVVGVARSSGALQHDREGERTEPFGDRPNPAVPSLTTMALGALETLQDRSDAGMFLVVEAATVDSAGHAGELGRTIEEMVAFNDAVEAVVDWVERESSWEETLLVVTSDHETGNLWGPGTAPGGQFFPLTGVAGELPEAVFTDFTDGAPGDRAPHYHTHHLVPVYAKGAGAERLEAVATGEDPVRGDYLLNTELSDVVREVVRGEA